MYISWGNQQALGAEVKYVRGLGISKLVDGNIKHHVSTTLESC